MRKMSLKVIIVKKLHSCLCAAVYSTHMDAVSVAGVILLSEGTYMCTGGEYPGLLCPLVSRWSSEPLSSSWAECNRVGGLPLSVPGGLPPSSPGGLPPNSPGGLPPIRPDGSPPRRPWQLPPIGPVEPLFMRPGVPSNGREVSARAACRREGKGEEILRINGRWLVRGR